MGPLTIHVSMLYSNAARGKMRKWLVPLLNPDRAGAEDDGKRGRVGRKGILRSTCWRSYLNANRVVKKAFICRQTIY